MNGIAEMFTELMNWQWQEYEYKYAAVWERLLEEKRERERERRQFVAKCPPLKKAVLENWNKRDKARRATDPEYREKRRAATRERMRRLRERRKLERNT